MCAQNITWHDYSLSKKDREKLKGHKGAVLWFTGLSGAGKSTIASALEQKFFESHIHSFALDGDNLRHGLTSDLKFSEKDRKENIRRVGEVAKLFVDAGLIVTASFISPYRTDRESVRRLLQPNEFIEVYVKCPIAECESRDPKGLYAKARNGEIQQFTGIDAPYEEPLHSEITLPTDQLSIEACADKVMAYLQSHGIIDG